MKAILATFSISIALCGTSLDAATEQPSTSLLLSFENNTTGAGGETPITSDGLSYTAGVNGQAASLGNPNQLYYSRTGNIDSRQGTLEFWIKPNWAGNDGQNHVILKMDSGGGMLFGKDGANNWRCIFNRFSANGQPERGVSFNIGTWQAGEWHHAAFTWGAGELRLYLDGSLKASTSVPQLPDIATSTTNFQLGGDGTGSYINSTIDELRISSTPLTQLEIQENYLADIPGITALAATPATWSGWPTWSTTPVLTATTTLGQISVPPGVCQWASSNPSVAVIDSTGNIKGVGPGTATLTATVRGRSATIAVTVNTPRLPPEDLAVDAALATPAVNAVHDMPVAIITYLPTLNGVNMDATESASSAAISSMRATVLNMSRRVKFMLEEGSRFRGYKNAAAPPSLGYRIVKNIIVYEPLPPGKPAGGGASFPDYNQIIQRWGGQQLVQQLGVKQIWLWGYHTSKIVPVESNMASPTSGDVSNSYRDNTDMPVYDRTYVLYNYNYNRTQAEAVHNHGHQLEAMLSYINQRQDGNTDLFWNKFCGRTAGGAFQQGRCGNTHWPPNATSDYNYTNVNPVLSDCEDWKPDGSGAKKLVSAQTWGGISYAWPGTGTVPQRTESQYYIYWMQNIPGLHSGIRMDEKVLRNWWEFTADWDKAIRESRGLHKGAEISLNFGPPAPVTPTFPSLRLKIDAGFPWSVEFSEDLENWLPLVSGINATGGEVLVTDSTTSPLKNRRYYRARALP
jgi:hypothetical protein